MNGENTRAEERGDRHLAAVTTAVFLLSFSLILLELLLTRLFAIVLFAQLAHLALVVALLGISIGAIAQHLWPDLVPDKGLERRLALLSILQGVATLLAVVACLDLPIIQQFEEPPIAFGERSVVRDSLLNTGWLAVLLPVLTAPFSVAGLSIAGTFHRRRRHIGRIYGSDLIGGAAGAVLFIPALGVLAGPDLVFLICLATAASSLVLFRSSGSASLTALSGTLVAASAALVLIATSGDVLRVRYAAGFSEDNVTYSRWTPLARVSVHETNERTGAMILLDNSSASDVLRTTEDVEWASRVANHRSLVYRLHDTPARVAILAASAGPDVAVAQLYGHTRVTAIDITADIFDIVATRFADAPRNPYVYGDTVRVESDGRAAILHAAEPFDIIQMVHANLWSLAGRIASAWSPALLETVEAFETYLDKLSPDGTLSFSRGAATDAIARAAAAALQRRGASEPWTHIFYLKSPANLLLVKKRPWTPAEVQRVEDLAETYRGDPIYLIHPSRGATPEVKKLLFEGPLMTDDRPYLDGPHIFVNQLKRTWRTIGTGGEDRSPLAQLYRSIVVQFVFVVVAGFAFLGLPLLRRGPTQLRGLDGVPTGLLYVSCLGYGYLAVETVLIHELILFVGHPIYAMTVVLLSLLLFSGAGSILAGRLAQGRVLPVLRAALIATLALGALQASIVPSFLHEIALGWPVGARMAITFAVLGPLGLAMGMPFPLAVRLLQEHSGGLLPWAWALNGWMSVLAGLATVLVSRMFGYSWAFMLALAAYLVALLLAGRLPQIGPASSVEPRLDRSPSTL